MCYKGSRIRFLNVNSDEQHGADDSSANQLHISLSSTSQI